MILADAHNATSGVVDAFIWVLVYGSIAAIIYGVVKGLKSARSTESISSEKETSIQTISQSKKRRITKKLSKLEPPRCPPLPGQGVVIAGRLRVRSNSRIWGDSSVREGVKIGTPVVVGLGSVVLKDILDIQVHVGNQSRLLK